MPRHFEKQADSPDRGIPLPEPGAGRPRVPERIIPNPKLKLLEQVREVMRLKHYSLRTERAYSDWIRRFVKFHRMQRREEMLPGRAKMELFLSDLAVNGQVAAATQNQAFNALLFLYREVLHAPLEGVQAVRAQRPVKIPVVLTPEEVKGVMSAMTGPPLLVVKLIYGSGLRLMEALRLREVMRFKQFSLRTEAAYWNWNHHFRVNR